MVSTQSKYFRGDGERGRIMGFHLIVQCIFINKQTQMGLMNFKLVLLLLLARMSLGQSVISSADFTSNIISGAYSPGNVVGISMYFPEIIPYWNNSIFIARQNTSMFDRSYSNAFSLIIHVPMGYKYGCSTTVYGATVTCTYDISRNVPLTTTINKFFFDLGNFFTNDLGWDMERSNFSRSSYMTNFRNYFSIFSNSGVNIELVDFGDQMGTIYNRTYTATNFVSDVNIIYNTFYGAYCNGPGISENADSSWISQLDTLYKNYFTTFTFRCIVFRNISLATIDNLLHENYSRVYLRNRLVDQNKKLLDFKKYPIAINEIRLTNDSGIDGVTNSFAAALWALDISVQFASLPGYSINFYNPLTPSNQSVFGAGPSFAPGALYYGLLFATYALKNFPQIQRVNVTAGTSAKIKIFGLDLYDEYKFLIINKDTNPNISGVVNIKHSYAYGYRCYYLSAPALNSTTNITFAGMYFEGNNPNYVGSFQYKDYKPSPDNIYSFELAYAQAALCQQIERPSDSVAGREFPRGRSNNLAGSHLFYGLFVMIVILALQ